MFTFISMGLDHEQWNLVETKNDIRIYDRTDESGKKWLRFTTHIHENMENVVEFTAEIDKLPTWVYSCKNSKLLSDSEEYTHYYFETDLPFPMTDRYLLVKKHKSGSPKGDYFKTVSVNYNNKDIDSDLVRVTEFQTIWHFQKIGENETLVTYDLYSDAGLPSWLDDKVNKIGPVNTLRSLKDKFTFE
jgi:hypothetical protein